MLLAGWLAPPSGGLGVGAQAETPFDRASGAVAYEVDLAQREHHEAVVTVRFPAVEHERLTVHMSRSSPGRYALHEFAKDVYSIRAYDPQGGALEVERATPYTWSVSDAQRGVVFQYTLFGDRVDGTYAAIDTTHAHLNVPASFAWADGLDDRPITVRFRQLPPGWRVSTQLFPGDDGSTFSAPSYAYFADSPIEASHHQVYSWQVEGPQGQRQTVRLAIHHLGRDAEAEAYVKLAKAVVDEEVAIFGEAPRYDGGVYTFLADYLPWASGDGMEHRNSTVLTSVRSLENGAVNNLGTVAHELFHSWSIERLRPATLEPFDFTRANMSAELWFGEGFTSYYDDLVLRRIGAISFERFVERVSAMVAPVVASRARAYGSPASMSQRAPFVDAATSIDPTNNRNTFLSYYTWGSALGLAFDLELRQRGSSLDALMARLWRELGREEAGYTNADLERVLGELVHDPKWAHELFAASVYGGELPDYRALLAQAGMLYRLAAPERAWMGEISGSFEGERWVLRDPVEVGSPLYRAGIDRGDVVLAVDGRVPHSESVVEEVLEERQPGDRVALRVERRGGGSEEVSVELEADPRIEVVSYESADLSVSPEVEAFRERWLASRVGPHPELVRYCEVDRHAFPFEYEHCPIHGVALSLARPED